jgi:hypothetical protein
MALVCSCGAQLPDNARFCLNCGKPQREHDLLREAAPEPEAPPPAVPSEAPAAPPVSFGNPIALRVSLLCASLSAMLNSLPVVGLGCCLWMIGAGFLAVYLYGRRTGLLLAVRQGARLGGMTGLLSFVITMVLIALSLAVEGGAGGGIRNALQESMKRFSGQDETTRQVIAFLASPAGLAITLITYLGLGFCAMISLAMAGGALGAKVLERE